MGDENLFGSMLLYRGCCVDRDKIDKFLSRLQLLRHPANLKSPCRAAIVKGKNVAINIKINVLTLSVALNASLMDTLNIVLLVKSAINISHYSVVILSKILNNTQPKKNVYFRHTTSNAL